MKAFLYSFDAKSGRDWLGLKHPAQLTKDYTSLARLWRYAIYPFARRYGNCHAYIYYGEQCIKPDQEITYNPAIKA